MTGTLISRKPIEHRCAPWITLVPIPEGDLLSREAGTMYVHDESSKYHNGDVLECDECHRRWTLHWPGSVTTGGYHGAWSNKRWHGMTRLMACGNDWVPETNRQFRRRMKHE